MNNAMNRYEQIIEHIFREKYSVGDREVRFLRDDIIKTAMDLNVQLPKNLGDLIYSFRFRTEMPASIQETASAGENWTIELAGRGQYRFILKPISQIIVTPNPHLSETKIPDATPGIIAMYALNDEQALLAKLRYNRLLDIFTGITCYSLQNHLRSTTPTHGQVETDELYVGIDKRGVHYVLPVQAKGGHDRLSVVQIEQDLALCTRFYPSLQRRAIGTQFLAGDVIALFEFEETEKGITVASERHYRLVPPDQLTQEDLNAYQRRLAE